MEGRSFRTCLNALYTSLGLTIKVMKALGCADHAKLVLSFLEGIKSMNLTTQLRAHLRQKLLPQVLNAETYERHLVSYIKEVFPKFELDTSIHSKTTHIVIKLRNNVSESGTPDITTYSTVLVYLDGIFIAGYLLAIPTPLEIESILVSVVFIMDFLNSKSVFFEVDSPSFSYFKENPVFQEKFSHLPSFSLYKDVLNRTDVTWTENTSFGKYADGLLFKMELENLKSIPPGMYMFIELNKKSITTGNSCFKKNKDKLFPLREDLFIQQAN